MKIYSIKEVAEKYVVSNSTVEHWIHTGQLRAVNVGRDAGKKRARWRISESALAAFEETRAAHPPVQPTRRRRTKADADGVTRFYGGW